MSKALTFLAGAAAGAAGLCWVIDKFTAGIQWYASAEQDPEKQLRKLSTTIWDDDTPFVASTAQSVPSAQTDAQRRTRPIA